MNEVAIDHTGALYWNGKPISREQLIEYLKISHTLNPEPTVFLQTEMGVPCSALDALREQMDQMLECKKSNRCAEGIISVWRELPTPQGTGVS
jgi:biopolymer transport protein ExbD